MRKLPKLIGFGALVVIVGIQFIRPEKTNPSAEDSLFYDRSLHPPPAITRLIETSCLDCHSFRTRWPWYSNVAPASWLVASDVKEGRRHLNFSIWGSYSTQRQLVALNDITDMISQDDMPPGNYLLLHREARLDSAARRMLLDWVEAVKDSIPG